MTGRWFSPGIPVSSINKPDRHDKTFESGVIHHTLTLTVVFSNTNTHTDKGNNLRLEITTRCIALMVEPAVFVAVQM